MKNDKTKPDIKRVKFTVSLGDGYCEYSYKIYVDEEESIRSIYEKLCRAVDSPMSEGRFVYAGRRLL